MPTYFLTGATGFIGSRLASRLAARDDCDTLYVLVRESSQEKLGKLLDQCPNSDKLIPVIGDLTRPGLGVDVAALDPAPDHVIHLAASYDVTASDEENDLANVTGTKHALEFAAAVGNPVFHHTSSIAVAGLHAGTFTEDDFALGQAFPSPYHRTKYESEAFVREQDSVPYRIYRPSVVVGDSRTGEIDKVDGPYYMLPAIARLSRLPRWFPLVGANLGRINLVPVDFVVSSMAALIHADVPSGSVFHLSEPEGETYSGMINAFSAAMNGPRMRGALPVPTRRLRSLATTSGRSLIRQVIEESLSETGVPAELLSMTGLPVVFDNAKTRAALAELGQPTEPAPFADYAENLVSYWIDHLDPDRFRRVDPEHPLLGKKAVITGGSSGIGRALAMEVAQMGAIVILLARRADELDAAAAEIAAAGGEAHTYPVDLTDDDAVNAVVKRILGEHQHIDFLVNNAGRSIRRSVMASVDRLHDFERTIQINYLAVVRLTLAFLPSMIDRQAGHIVNITTGAVDIKIPKWAAYSASKAAVDTFGIVAGEDLLADGITVSNVRMPLVRTPMSAPTRSVSTLIPTIDPTEAVHKYVIGPAMIKKKPVVTRIGTGPIVAAYSLIPRLTRVSSHLVAGQGLGETAPDVTSRNRTPVLVRVVGTAVRLGWRRMATRPIRRS